MSEEKQKIKYGVLPPLKVADSNGKVASYVAPGCSMDEWSANLPKALEELMATFTPEEQAEIRAEQAQIRAKKKRKRR